MSSGPIYVQLYALVTDGSLNVFEIVYRITTVPVAAKFIIVLGCKVSFFL